MSKAAQATTDDAAITVTMATETGVTNALLDDWQAWMTACWVTTDTLERLTDD
jgi:hypothetical protein